MREASSALMNPLQKSTTHRFRARFVLLCTLCFVAVLPLSATQINIFNTGLNGPGSATLAGGAADTHWGCFGNCTSTFQAQTTAPANFPNAGNSNWPLPSTQNTTPGTGPWVASAAGPGLAGISPASGAVSQWITFNQPNVFIDPSVTLEYDYFTLFDLTAFIVSSYELQGVFAVDNTTFGLQINGHPVTSGVSGLGSSSGKTAFDITNASCIGGCGLFAGAGNTLVFRVLNQASGVPDATGLLVEFSSSTATATQTAVPEPATLFGVGLGLSILGLVYRRRRKLIFV
jgi:PEP-CTERM motif